MYNGESVLVRHACFAGADELHEKLQRALRADIDKVAWKSLSSTVSWPFDRHETGRIAGKPINHGDEVPKVIDVT